MPHKCILHCDLERCQVGGCMIEIHLFQTCFKLLYCTLAGYFIFGHMDHYFNILSHWWLQYSVLCYRYTLFLLKEQYIFSMLMQHFKVNPYFRSIKGRLYPHNHYILWCSWFVQCRLWSMIPSWSTCCSKHVAKWFLFKTLIQILTVFSLFWLPGGNGCSHDKVF